MKKITLVLACVACTYFSAFGVEINFTSGEGYSDNAGSGQNVVGQQGWVKQYGPNDLLQVLDDSLVPYANTGGGAIYRILTEEEIGGPGWSFDDASSIIDISYTFTLTGSSMDPVATWAPGFTLRWSDRNANEQLSVGIRPDGIMEVSGATGTPWRSGSIFSASPSGNSYTINISADNAADDFTVSVVGDSGLVERTDGFRAGSVADLHVRIDGGFLAGDTASGNVGGNTLVDSSISLNSLTIVPEPSVYALLAGFLALGWVMVRRRE